MSTPVWATRLLSWGERAESRIGARAVPTRSDQELENGLDHELEGRATTANIPPSALDGEEGAPLQSLEEGTIASNSNNNGGDGDGDSGNIVTVAMQEETNNSSTDNENSNEESAGTQEGLNRRLQHTSYVTLSELEEERELSRRRSGVCFLICTFILFRMWIEAIFNSDFALYLICMILTSWAARWLRYNWEREAELDRRIEEYWNTHNNTHNNGDDTNNNQEGNAERGMPRSDLQMLSFQAQLALAIMESQRQMMQGGYGHPDGSQDGSSGVTDQTKSKWERYTHHGTATETPKITPSKNKTKNKTNYKSVSTKQAHTITNSDNDDPNLQKPDTPLVGETKKEEVPNCSICLCEYEHGDNLVCLPCSHVYHDDCVSAWTSNHVRCPLCNFDLQNDTAPPESIV